MRGPEKQILDITENALVSKT